MAPRLPHPHASALSADRTDLAAERQRWQVRAWLWALVALVLAMAVVGAATRLTGSGLSITEWQPIVGALPPLSAADWQTAFDKYRQIPQYREVNRGMSLEAFKVIYWWEWGHRFLGRCIGVVFTLPFILFLARGWIAPRMKARLLAVLALGALQGFVGWYMVQSGLVGRTDVSQYRLALHLTLAALIFAALVWLALEHAPDDRHRARLQTLPAGSRTWAKALVALLLLQIALGALVAGMKAGLAHNTWPLMDGRLIPPGLLVMSPWWVNAFENALTVQFDHRMLAYGIALLASWHAARTITRADDERVRRSAGALLAVTLAQVGLGIWTLLAQVPLGLGLAHQALAFILLGVAVRHVHAIARS